MANNIVEIPANLVKTGDIVFHKDREYLIVHINRLSDVVQLQHSGGFFNFELGRLVKIVERPEQTSLQNLLQHEQYWHTRYALVTLCLMELNSLR